MTSCSNELDLIYAELEKTLNGFSYYGLAQYAKTGDFDKIMGFHNIDELLRSELLKFILILEDKNFYSSRLGLYESEYYKIYKDYIVDYMLSTYFKNMEAYRLFPLSFYENVKRYHIAPYDTMPYEKVEEIITKHLRLTYRYDMNINKNVHEIPFKFKLNKDKYDRILPKVYNNTINFSDKNEFFVWSEYKTYQEEVEEFIKLFPNLNPADYIKWTAKDFGDGYGYDVQRCNPFIENEKIIESKSGESSSINLTENEYDIAIESIGIKNSDYYVKKFVYNKGNNAISKIVLKMNKQTGLFMDSRNNNYYGIKYPFYDQKTGKEKIVVGLVIEQEYYQIQENKNKQLIKEI